MNILSKLLFFALGFFVAWALFIILTSTPNSAPACTSLADCFLKSQTFFAALVALVAAIIGYRGVLYTVAENDRRQRKENQDKERTLALTLAAEFEAISEDFCVLSNGAQELADDIERGKPLPVPGFLAFAKYDLPASVETAMSQIGSLGDTAVQVSKTVRRIRAHSNRNKSMRSIATDGEHYTPDSVRSMAGLFEGIQSDCDNTAELLRNYATSIPKD